MEKWEIALDKFMSRWRDRDDVVGAIVCGSYVTGNPSSHSDIDVQIILDDNVLWRERGNEYVDGFLIEYFANPSYQNVRYYKSDFEQRRRINIHMFLSGRVLFDKDGSVKRNIELAREWDKKEYPQMNEVFVEIAKYHIWDMKDNLEEVYDSNSDEFYFVYFVHLNNLLESYSQFCMFDKVSAHKVKRFLVDEKDKKKYDVKDFPDKEFVRMYVEAMKLKDKGMMIKEYVELTEHVLEKMGGFDIDGWKIKSNIEK